MGPDWPVSRKRPDAMWCVVMFDLPTGTKEERRDATRFRKLLEDAGFSMIQYSVYGKYSPSLGATLPLEAYVQASLPPDGEVLVLHLTDHQWAKALRFRAKNRVPQESAPDQLVLF